MAYECYLEKRYQYENKAEYKRCPDLSPEEECEAFVSDVMEQKCCFEA